MSDTPLFLSETGQGLTENGIVSVFGCLRERAGVMREDMGPTLVRNSFVVRSLQAGGNVFTLRDLLGHQESTVVKRFLRMSEQGAVKNETEKERTGVLSRNGVRVQKNGIFHNLCVDREHHVLRPLAEDEEVFVVVWEQGVTPPQKMWCVPVKQ